MTAQIPDSVLLDGERFSIAGVAGDGLFDPAAHGIEPRMIHTACWRGVICTYTVADDRLLLDELQFGAGSTRNGVELGPDSTLFGVKAGDWLTFTGLAQPVPFTGGLLLGADFVRSTYVHMGFHPAWKYARVVELLVNDGLVTARHDRSAQVAELRDRIQAGAEADPDGARGGVEWVERTFTLDYTRTFPQ